MSTDCCGAGVTTEDIPVAAVLAGAQVRALTEVVVIGITPEGKLHFATSKGGTGDILTLLKVAEHWLVARTLEDLS